MKKRNLRDLMVVAKDSNVSPEIMEAETTFLNELLNQVETLQNVAACCEVFNLVRYRVEKKNEKVLKALNDKTVKPFHFIFNKN